MGDDYRARNNHIKEAFTNGSIEKSVELLRDLMGLREIKAWSNTENDAANTIFNQLASEYSVIYEIPLEEARQEINSVICAKFENFSML
jgi:RNA polymerase-interacting CarD/CdnL/TRCF family regulator